MEFTFQGAGVTHPTTCGHILQFPDGSVTGELVLRFASKDESDWLPRDFVALDLAVADEQGDEWVMEATFGADAFLSCMGNPQLMTRCFSVDESKDEEIRKTFESRPILDAARFSSDDRSYRIVPVGEKTIEFLFKYTTLTFDVFWHTSRFGDEDFLVCLRRNSIMLADGTLAGAIAFRIPPLHLLQFNAWTTRAEGREPLPFPKPLFFRKTGRKIEPQADVVVRAS